MREDIFRKRETFSGAFSANYQEESIPTSLKTPMGFILEDPETIEQTDMDTKPKNKTKQAALTLLKTITEKLRNILLINEGPY